MRRLEWRMSADRLKLHPVVFLHGVGGAGRAWTPQMASFPAAGLVAFAPDLPRYGGRPPITPMDFDGLARHGGPFVHPFLRYKRAGCGHDLTGGRE